MASRLQGILQELRERLGQLYGARLERLVLFGSQARGDAASDSDIDVLVVLHGMVMPGAEISRSGPLIAALSLEHDIAISCVFVSSACYQEEQSPLLLNVRREGVLV